MVSHFISSTIFLAYGIEVRDGGYRRQRRITKAGRMKAAPVNGCKLLGIEGFRPRNVMCLGGSEQGFPLSRVPLWNTLGWSRPSIRVSVVKCSGETEATPSGIKIID